VLIPNLFERFGTETLPSFVSSVRIFISSSSNLCKLNELLFIPS